MRIMTVFQYERAVPHSTAIVFSLGRFAGLEIISNRSKALST